MGKICSRRENAGENLMFSLTQLPKIKIPTMNFFDFTRPFIEGFTTSWLSTKDLLNFGTVLPRKESEFFLYLLRNVHTSCPVKIDLWRTMRNDDKHKIFSYLKWLIRFGFTTDTISLSVDLIASCVQFNISCRAKKLILRHASTTLFPSHIHFIGELLEISPDIEQLEVLAASDKQIEELVTGGGRRLKYVRVGIEPGKFPGRLAKYLGVIDGIEAHVSSSDRELNEIAVRLPQLRQLTFRSENATTDAGLISVAINCRHLEVLKVHRGFGMNEVHFGADGFNALCQNLPNLMELEVHDYDGAFSTFVPVFPDHLFPVLQKHCVHIRKVTALKIDLLNMPHLCYFLTTCKTLQQFDANALHYKKNAFLSIATYKPLAKPMDFAEEGWVDFFDSVRLLTVLEIAAPCLNLSNRLWAIAKNCPGLLRIRLNQLQDDFDQGLGAIVVHCPALRWYLVDDCANFTSKSILLLLITKRLYNRAVKDEESLAFEMPLTLTESFRADLKFDEESEPKSIMKHTHSVCMVYRNDSDLYVCSEFVDLVDASAVKAYYQSIIADERSKQMIEELSAPLPKYRQPQTVARAAGNLHCYCRRLETRSCSNELESIIRDDVKGTDTFKDTLELRVTFRAYGGDQDHQNDAMMNAIARKFPQLRLFTLQGNQLLTQQTLFLIADKLKHLRVLVLVGCKQFTLEGVERVMESCASMTKFVVTYNENFGNASKIKKLNKKYGDAFEIEWKKNDVEQIMEGLEYVQDW